MTSREVAKAAGVSQATVSNVLNRPELVALETRLRVRKVIESLGFVVNDGARQLRVGRSLTLAVSILDVSNPFWADVTRGIADYAAERGYVIALASTGESLEREHRYLRLFEEQRVAAILAAPVDADLGDLRRMASTGMAVVLLDASDPANEIPYVAVDDIEGGAVAGRHLLNLGHRRIACINGPHDRLWSEDRWTGMVRAVREAGLDPGTTLIREPVATLTAYEGHRAAQEIVRNNADVTAIFCDNDMLALGALHALAEHAIAVPGRISVMGYDDGEFSEMISPPLTTVRQQPYDLGRSAAEIAVSIIEVGDLLSISSGRFVPSLVERRSTGGITAVTP